MKVTTDTKERTGDNFAYLKIDRLFFKAGERSKMYLFFIFLTNLIISRFHCIMQYLRELLCRSNEILARICFKKYFKETLLYFEKIMLMEVENKQKKPFRM